MAFEDLLGSLAGMFGGGETPAPAPAAPSPSGGFAPQPDSGGFNIGSMLGPLLLGGGTMLASKLLGRGEQKDIDKATKNIRSGANTASTAGQTMVDRASQGKLTDAQQARVDRMKAEQNAQWGQRFAQMGIPMSTMASQATNLVDTQAEELAGKLINESFDSGIRALGLGTQSSQVLLSNAMQQKKELASTIGEVAKQLGVIFNKPGAGTPQQPQPSANANVPIEWAGSDVYDISSPEGMGV
jgi:hypothetical protein